MLRPVPALSLYCTLLRCLNLHGSTRVCRADLLSITESLGISFPCDLLEQILLAIKFWFRCTQWLGGRMISVGTWRIRMGKRGRKERKRQIIGKITKLRLAVVSTHFTAMPFFKKYYNTFQLTFWIWHILSMSQFWRSRVILWLFWWILVVSLRSSVKTSVAW